jgi:hypothetical protein
MICLTWRVIGNVFNGISSLQHEKMATTIGQMEDRTHLEHILVIIPIIILGLGTQRKPPTCRKSLPNFITWGYISRTPRDELGSNSQLLWDSHWLHRYLYILFLKAVCRNVLLVVLYRVGFCFDRKSNMAATEWHIFSIGNNWKLNRNRLNRNTTTNISF